MNFKQTALGILSRIFRFAGILLIIYVSMVFYLALTERRNAFPRAITHIEAREAIRAQAKPVSCTLEDGVSLEGWTLGNGPTLLYYPDADEDGAQFLAEVQQLQGYTLMTFNYRGSGDNKGTPSQETFEPDARAIAECARQIGNKIPEIIAGRGTGAILAAEQLTQDHQKLILIDPAPSIAYVIGAKYRALYPEFLVRAKIELPRETLMRRSQQAILLEDRAFFCERNHIIRNSYSNLKSKKRGDSSLNQTILDILHFN